MDRFELGITMKVPITQEDIDDIMAAALEGGICYWCGKAEVVGEYLGEYGHEQVSRGGKLRLYDVNYKDAVYQLTLEKLMNGIRLMVVMGLDTYNVVSAKGIDTMNVDACVADTIVQLGLFGELVYG